MYQKKYRGFALSLDVAVVIVCICLLTLVGLIGFQSYVKSAKINRAKADTAALALAVAQYAYDMENVHPDHTPAQCLPTDLVDLEKQYDGKGPWLSGNTITKSGTSYLDPWGNVYIYTHGSGNDGRFVVYSKGPKGNGTVSIIGVASSEGIGATGGFLK